MSSISNEQIYGVLLDIKGDIGGLQESSKLQLAAITNHSGRLTVLETAQAKQAGATRVWALVATALGTAVGAVASFFRVHHQ